MTLSIAQVPQDILLEFAKQLDVADLLSFLSICRTIRELRFQRALWLDALIRIREVQMQPLPLSTTEALDALSLPELQIAVQQAHRLMQNLQSDTPLPVRIHTFSVNAGAQVLCIPGASLAVSHILGGVSCWDILTGHRVAHLEIPELQIRTEVCMKIKGKALIGAHTRSVENFAVICIDFHDRSHISISHVISPPMNHPDNPQRSFFINAQVMGSCTISNIISWSWNSNATLRIEPPDDLNPAIPLPSTSDHHPTGSDAQPTTLMIPYPIGSSPQELHARHGETGFGGTLYTTRVFVPHYGIFAVTGRAFHFGQSLNPSMQFIHFWPGRTAQGNLEFGQVHLYEHPHDIRKMAVGASGTYVLLLATDVERYLGLLHFSATPEPHTTFRKLDIGNVFLASCSQIALDDSLGLVFVVDAGGVVTVVSYV